VKLDCFAGINAATTRLTHRVDFVIYISSFLLLVKAVDQHSFSIIFWATRILRRALINAAADATSGVCAVSASIPFAKNAER
jgi:hypothetical protein